MVEVRSSPTLRTIPFLIATCHCERSAAIRFRVWVATAVFLLALVSAATAKYSGGSGTAQDPYQIATATDLMLLGETPADYGKDFVMTADIDLDPKLPGRKVFDKAIIAPDTDPTEYFQGTWFAGVFDGNGHTISHLTIKGKDDLGLFGLLSGEVKNVGVVDANVTGSGVYVGGLVGEIHYGGRVIRCYGTGAVSGRQCVGSLVGAIIAYVEYTGPKGYVTQCYSTGSVSGDNTVGGLVGYNNGYVTQCYSTGAVGGSSDVGGLVGYNGGDVTHCCSTSEVSGASNVGGLVGSGTPAGVMYSVWDIDSARLSGSAGGVGLTTTEMMDPFMLGLNGFANDPNWVLDAGRDYPRLAWERTGGQIVPSPKIDWLAGRGTPEEPYRIDIADQLILLGKASILWDKHFLLGSDINLDPKLPRGQVFGQAVIQTVAGLFDGNGHTVSHLTVKGGSYLGLFGQVAGEVKDLAVVDVNITGSGSDVGGLVGENWGHLTRCYGTGAVSSTAQVGGLVGFNGGAVVQCYSRSKVTGDGIAGGLVGQNGFVAKGEGSFTNYGRVSHCYSTGTTKGNGQIGGLVGHHAAGDVSCCYSTAAVSGDKSVGGLTGSGLGEVTASFWDTQTSGQTTSAAGTGKTTAQMQTAKTFLDAGWDFVGETKNGKEDIWWILEGKDYPRLWWEAHN